MKMNLCWLLKFVCMHVYVVYVVLCVYTCMKVHVYVYLCE